MLFQVVSSNFPTKTLHVFIFSLIQSAFRAAFVILDLVSRMIFGEKYIVICYYLCRLLQSPVTTNLFGLHIFITALFCVPIT